MPIDSRVSVIMTEDVIVVGPESPVDEVARLMWENNISSVPVVENGRLIGILSDYDMIARETQFEGPMFITFLDAYFQIPGSGDPKQLRRILATTARELMTSPVVSIAPTATVQEAATIMYDKRLGALPVVDESANVVGIVSRADIVRLMVADEDTYIRTHPEAI